MRTGKAFLNLKKEKEKGANGTILVIGGSELYTGAPIFSATAAFKTGSDLVFIFTSPKASASIKNLHEAVVSVFRYDERVLEKITACVIGPGLGEIGIEVLNTIIKILYFLNNRKIPIIIDADGIHYYKQGHFDFLECAILTPNFKECIDLTVKEGHICIYKSLNDTIAYEGSQYWVFNAGSKKRCGGQGDILTGVLASAVSICKNNLLDACISACELTRNAAFLAFEDKGFSVMTGDVLDKLPLALKNVMGASTRDI